jgi:oxygen-dependent protoporphyrinogen oxidase
MPHIVIVGGGIAGLAAAWKCAREASGTSAGSPEDPLRITLLEAAPRFGGKIATERAGGFLIEGGADSFAGRKPRGVGLVRELGLEDRLIPTGSGAPDRPTGRDRGGVFLAMGGRLVALPAGLSLVVPTRAGPLARSPLLSARGKLRVGMDLVMPRRGGGRFGRRGDRWGERAGARWFGRRRGRWGERAGARWFGRRRGRPLRLDGGAGALQGEGAELPDESVAEFVRRRFGAEYLERIAGPLLGGIHSTDPEVLSMEAAFPHLSALERRHRSLLLGVRRGNGSRPPSPEQPPRSRPGDSAAARVSLSGGMGELVEVLVDRLRDAGVDLRSSTPVAGLELASASGSEADLWTVHPAGAPALSADALVLATPASVTAELLEALDPHLSAPLRAIPQISTATVSLGFPASVAEAVAGGLRGMGFLVPRSEGRLVSACTFSSLKFPGRAPDGQVLLRAFVGGAGNWEAGGRPDSGDDDALIDLVRSELAQMLGAESLLDREPVVARVHRFVEANPQYRVGHPGRVRELEGSLPGGLALAGCAYHGLGIPDCIASGERAAATALSSCRAPRR